MPGEFVEIYADELKCFKGEIDVESNMEPPLPGNWPAPSQVSVQIPNLRKELVHISRSQHIPQIRCVIVPLQIQDCLSILQVLVLFYQVILFKVLLTLTTQLLSQ